MPMLWSMNLNARKKFLVSCLSCFHWIERLIPDMTGHVDVRRWLLRYDRQHIASPSLDQIWRLPEPYL